VSEADGRIEITPAAQRQLRRLPPGAAARLRGPILALALDARSPGAMKLADTEFWRLRVGDLRVIYMVDGAEETIIVLKVARRSESTYRFRS
jgi:mRNA interferase RelE/StbE